MSQSLFALDISVVYSMAITCFIWYNGIIIKRDGEKEMLVKIFSLYLQGLLGATLLTSLSLGCWVLYRKLSKQDVTRTEKRAILFDALVLAFISIPILSFAFMAILVMLKA